MAMPTHLEQRYLRDFTTFEEVKSVNETELISQSAQNAREATKFAHNHRRDSDLGLGVEQKLSFTESASADLHKQAISVLIEEKVLQATFVKQENKKKMAKMIGFDESLDLSKLRSKVIDYAEYIA